MDTLSAANTSEAAGMDRKQAEAVAKVMNEQGRDDLVTKSMLEAALWKHTAMIVGSFIAIAGLFKLFS